MLSLSKFRDSGAETVGIFAAWQHDTHVFWWARWMQLKICPFSGSVLYMAGYCEAKQRMSVEN